MAISTYPLSSSGLKSYQSGTTGSATTITISSVNTSKTFVHSYPTGSAGSVGATGSIGGTLSPSGGSVATTAGGGAAGGGTMANYSGTTSFSGGTTNLTSAEYGVYLTSSTTLVSTGACFYQVIEYN